MSKSSGGGCYAFLKVFLHAVAVMPVMMLSLLHGVLLLLFLFLLLLLLLLVHPMFVPRLMLASPKVLAALLLVLLFGTLAPTQKVLLQVFAVVPVMVMPAGASSAA